MGLNPQCTVGNNPTPVDVAAGATGVEIELEFPAGAQFWGIQAIGVDDTANLAAINASLAVNQITKKATFTAPATLGSAVIFQSTVGIGSLSTQGAGYDVNNVLQPSWTTTFKVNVPTSGGLRVICLNEIFEQNSVVGWVEEINKGIRAAGGAVAPSVPAWLRVSAAGTVLTNAQSGVAVATDTTSAAFSIKLPASPTDAVEYEFVDATNQWATHALTIDGNGNAIVNPAKIGGTGGTASTIVLNLNESSVVLKWDATQSRWQCGVL